MTKLFSYKCDHCANQSDPQDSIDLAIYSAQSSGWTIEHFGEICPQCNQAVLLAMHTPIADLSLSTRSENALTAKGIRNIRQLICLSEPEVMRIPNLGITSIKEISCAIRQLHPLLSFKPE